MARLLIRNCDVLRFPASPALSSGAGLPVIDLGQDILVDGQKIQAIAPTGTIPLAPETEVLEAEGMLAVPGMVNTHAHVPMVLFRGVAEDVVLDEWFNNYIWPLESNLTPEDVYWGAQLGLAEMIENGITYVADHYFYMDEVAQAVQQAGIRANLAWAVFGHEGPAKLEQTIEFIQRWQGGADGRITTWLGPHAPYTTGPDFLRLCARRAREIGVGIHIHVSETSAQVELSLKEYGITPVQMLLETGVLDVPTIFGHCLYPSPADIDIMADHPCGVSQAPKTYLKAGMGLGPVVTLRQRGIPVGLASDGAASNNTLDLYEQMRLTALTQKHQAHDARAMTIAEVLEIAYRGGAQVVRRADDLGELEPGRQADIVLLRQDSLSATPRYQPAANLVYSICARDVDTVLCAGKLLLRHRQHLTLDKERIKQEVNARLERLVQRVPGRRIAVYPT